MYATRSVEEEGPVGNLGECHQCKCDINEGDPYAILWGPSDQPASIVGLLCMPCAALPQFKDITDEVKPE